MATQGSSNQTIYIQNINEKVKHDELKATLYHLFSRCGEILEVNLRRGNKYRGQAWITFNDIGGAVNAVKQYSGLLFYNKNLRIQFSKNKADIIAKADGTFVFREKKEEVGAIPQSNKRKLDSVEGSNKVARTNDSADVGAAREDGEAEPNPTLLAENLPTSITHLMVSKFFENAPGFVKVSLNAKRPGFAFVEFDSVENSTSAIQLLDGYEITKENKLKLTYSR